MANRTLNKQIMSYGAAPVIGAGFFTANGAGAPSTATIHTDGGPTMIASFAYSAVGIIAVTMADSFPYVLYAKAQIDDALAAGVRCETEIVSVAAGAAAVVKIRFYDAAGNPVAPGTQRVSLFCIFANTKGWNQ